MRVLSGSHPVRRDEMNPTASTSDGSKTKQPIEYLASLLLEVYEFITCSRASEWTMNRTRFSSRIDVSLLRSNLYMCNASEALRVSCACCCRAFSLVALFNYSNLVQ